MLKYDPSTSNRVVYYLIGQNYSSNEVADIPE